MDFIKISILICACSGLASTIFFLIWYNSDKSKINKKVKYFKIKGTYPNDSQASSYWDIQGWTEDSYNRFPSIQKEPVLYENPLFIEELKTNETIFKYLKISVFLVIFSIVVGGILLEFIIK